MSAISLIYGHDHRKGQRSYRFLGQSADVARSRISEIEVVLTRLGLEARFLNEASGYFSLWLRQGVRILGRASAREVDGKQTIEYRLIILEAGMQFENLVGWMGALHTEENWSRDSRDRLPAPKISDPSTDINSTVEYYSGQAQLPWYLIAPDSFKIVTRWYSRQGKKDQAQATFVLPCLVQSKQIANYLCDPCLTAPIKLKRNRNRSPNGKTITRKNHWSFVIFSLFAGIGIGVFLSPSLLKESTTTEPPPLPPPPVIDPGLSITIAQEQELEKAVRAITAFVEDLEAYGQWNRRLLDDPTNTALSDSLRHTKRYLSKAGESGQKIESRLDNLGFAIGDIAVLLNNIEHTSRTVKQLKQTLEETERVLSSLENSLERKRKGKQANPSFQSEIKKAQEARDLLQNELRNLTIDLGESDTP